MNDLIEWLGQALDEQAKKAVPNCVIISGGYPNPSVPNCIGRDGMGGCGWRMEGVVVRPGERHPSWDEAIYEHNLTHLTAGERFTLARIAADRQILLVHGVAWNAEVCTICHHYPDERTPERATWPCLTVRILALPHADRPGYREEWRP